MFAIGTFLKVHKSPCIIYLRKPVPIYRAYATMATDPKKYSLNRRYSTIDLTWDI